MMFENTDKSISAAQHVNVSQSGSKGISLPAVPIFRGQQMQSSPSQNQNDSKSKMATIQHKLSEAGKVSPPAINCQSPLQFHSSAPIQRMITIGKENFFLKDQRQFISSIQTEFPQHGYSVPNKLLVACVAALNGGGPLKDREFSSYEEFIDEMVKLELTGGKIKATSVKERPVTLGKRPVFHSEIAKIRNEIKAEKKNVQAARHVIPSHLLGYAAEQVQANVEELKAWVEEHQGELKLNQTSNSERVQRRNVWTILHNHKGNLWIGESFDNTVIGFISGNIQSAIHEIVVSPDPIAVVKKMQEVEAAGTLGKAMAEITNAIGGAFTAIIEEYNPNDITDPEFKEQSTKEMYEALTEVWEQVEADVLSFNLDEYKQASDFLQLFKEYPTLKLFSDFMETNFKGTIMNS